MGYEVRRAGELYFTLHPSPLGPVGYCPKPQVEKINLELLTAAGEKDGCIHIKIDSPNTPKPEEMLILIKQSSNLRETKPTFAQETIFLDLTQPEERLLEQMSQKTRYNVRLAQKKGVRIKEASDPKDFQYFLALQRKTAAKQRFYLHPDNYYQTLYELMQPAGKAHLLLATVEEEPCTAWLLFSHNAVLYYMYGGSSEKYHSLMPNNLMMWEAIKLGQRLGCELFDLGGINSDPKHHWAGVTRFKKGYGGRVVKFPPSYDLILKPWRYRLFLIADKVRWMYLNFRRRL